MIIRILILTTVMMVVSGCASTYRHSELQAPVAKLDSSLGVLISVPEDGWYENTQYRNSGRMAANAVRAAFSKNARKVDIAQDCRDEECLDGIDAEKYGYFVKPVILHWEERATEWSGKPDRIEIQIVIYDAVTKSEVANSSYTGKSKWATFGGDHPQDLLPEPTNEYVSNLYQ
ncbi:DUF4823 domain-containing protein [Methylohalobius crimeensis]|uniref:DUF4823 domain-containing protein n=1 Tax=Methylohalobius crimeensis TaxID=244365 RepID=UPI000A03FE8C|nr:DUF4823 domain-containing protein [Methylohalobius crimeensis]